MPKSDNCWRNQYDDVVQMAVLGSKLTSAKRETPRFEETG